MKFIWFQNLCSFFSVCPLFLSIPTTSVQVFIMNHLHFFRCPHCQFTRGLRSIFLNYSSVHTLMILQPAEYAFARHLTTFKIWRQPVFSLVSRYFSTWTRFQRHQEFTNTQMHFMLPHFKTLLLPSKTTACPLSTSGPS